MNSLAIDRVFGTRNTRQESKAEATSRAALAMTNEETSLREEKTRRLKAARLARDAAAAPAKKKSASKD